MHFLQLVKCSSEGQVVKTMAWAIEQAAVFVLSLAQGAWLRNSAL